MTTDQINLLSKGLKFTPTLAVKEDAVRKQLLLDLKQFARRMHLRYIFHNKDKERQPLPHEIRLGTPSPAISCIRNLF